MFLLSCICGRVVTYSLVEWWWHGVCVLRVHVKGCRWRGGGRLSGGCMNPSGSIQFFVIRLQIWWLRGGGMVAWVSSSGVVVWWSGSGDVK